MYAAIGYNHEQPMQFINHNYLQVKGGNHRVYQIMSKQMYSMVEDILFRVSVAFYVTMEYLYPAILHCLKQYSAHLATSSIFNVSLFLCTLTGMSSIICFTLLTTVITHYGHC